ncbi:hypothetical protein VNI00_016083 [Paramarasmius palmivorus]|uniref:Uncharacterized protein n=1 Tax=Paramarasmius palmivorus TaxID=297713 RepID=A0AAW0BG68_9AGAR
MSSDRERISVHLAAYTSSSDLICQGSLFHLNIPKRYVNQLHGGYCALTTARILHIVQSLPDDSHDEQTYHCIPPQLLFLLSGQTNQMVLISTATLPEYACSSLQKPVSSLTGYRELGYAHTFTVGGFEHPRIDSLSPMDNVIPLDMEDSITTKWLLHPSRAIYVPERSLTHFLILVIVDPLDYMGKHAFQPVVAAWHGDAVQEPSAPIDFLPSPTNSLNETSLSPDEDRTVFTPSSNLSCNRNGRSSGESSILDPFESPSLLTTDPSLLSPLSWPPPPDLLYTTVTPSSSVASSHTSFYTNADASQGPPIPPQMTTQTWLDSHGNPVVWYDSSTGVIGTSFYTCREVLVTIVGEDLYVAAHYEAHRNISPVHEMALNLHCTWLLFGEVLQWINWRARPQHTDLNGVATAGIRFTTTERFMSHNEVLSEMGWSLSRINSKLVHYLWGKYVVTTYSWRPEFIPVETIEEDPSTEEVIPTEEQKLFHIWKRMEELWAPQFGYIYHLDSSLLVINALGKLTLDDLAFMKRVRHRLFSIYLKPRA